MTRQPVSCRVKIYGKSAWGLISFERNFLFCVLQCVVPGFAGANFNRVLYIVNKNLAVANVAGVQHLFGNINNALNRNLDRKSVV